MIKYTYTLSNILAKTAYRQLLGCPSGVSSYLEDSWVGTCVSHENVGLQQDEQHGLGF